MIPLETESNWQRTSPIAVVFFLFKAARQFVNHGLPAVAVIVASYASASDSVRNLIQAGLLLALVVGIIGSVLSWLRFRYKIVDERVLVRSGVLHREELSVDFNRIQNISIREPFYARPFDLASLSIDTAGSGKEEIELSGIKKEYAVSLRATVLSRATTADTPGLDQPTDSTDRDILLSRSGKDIAIYGLTINIIIWLAIALGAIVGTLDSSEEVMLWITEKIQIEDLISLVPGSTDFFRYGILILGATLAILILLPMISVIGALFRHYGYELSVEGETYRKTSGLLSRHDESLKRHKIQALVLKQNFVARLFKRSNMQLRVASAGTGLEQGQLPVGPQRTFLVPALHPGEVTELTAEFLPGCEVDKTEFSRINLGRFARLILGLIVLPISLVPSTVLGIALGWEFLLVPLLMVGIGWFFVKQTWKKLGYSVVGEYGLFRNGFIGTKTTVFPLFKVQKVELRQTPGQRRAGLAHLTIHLASHSLKIPYMRIADARSFQDLMLYHAESTDRPWF